MENVQAALNEVQQLYKEMLGRPAPEIPPASYLSFPPGVDPIPHVMEEVAQLKRLSQQAGSAPSRIAWTPRADTFLSSTGILFEVEVPGLAREDLKVLLSGGECIVRGDRKARTGNPARRTMAIERPWGPFERRFALPAGVQPEKVSAKYRDGVLEILVEGDESGIPGEMTVEVQ